jgi:RNA polymerase sigma-70 factor (ECF subfamily)
MRATLFIIPTSTLCSQPKHASNQKVNESEERLLEDCRKGDRKAQRDVYEKYSGLMFSVCRRYISEPEAAEDVLVCGFMKVFSKIDQFKSEGSFEGWVRRIMVNESLTYIRKNKSLYMQVEIENAEREPDYSQLSDHLEEEDLMKMINRLPAGYRTVFNLYAIEGFSHKEIAEQLGISENTSKSQLSRARAHLQKLLIEAERFMNDKLMSHEG